MGTDELDEGRSLELSHDEPANALDYLVESLGQLESIIANVHDAVVSVDESGRIIIFNKAAQTIFGYNDTEMLGEPLTRLIPQRYVAEHAAHMQRFAQMSERSRMMDQRGQIYGLRRDGGEFPAEASISRSVTTNGQVFTVILSDITRRKQEEADRQRLLSIVEHSPDIIANADADGNIFYLNRTGRGFMGVLPSRQITALQLKDLHRGWALSQLLTEAIPYAVRDGSWIEESEICSPAGETLPVSQLILAHKDDNGNLLCLSSVMRDISEHKIDEAQMLESHRQLSQAYQRLEEAQSQLLQSEKMASVGQLAAGIAHEINNPVGYINSNLGSLKNYINDMWRMLDAYTEAEQGLGDASVRSRLDALKREIDIKFLREDIGQLIGESMEGVKRVKQIVQDLKDFSHVDEADWQWTDLHKGLDSTLNIAWNEIKYKAEVVKEYGDIPEVECIASQMNQVFMNLLVNAAHAIEQRGTITIRTGVSDNKAWIDIADTGKGMSEEVQKRIFEPFFTTKPVGKGTGLGLSLAYGIVQKHHGDISVISAPEQGTTFHIELPVQRIYTADEK
jgi:PAS domain S-box-containing protein